MQFVEKEHISLLYLDPEIGKKKTQDHFFQFDFVNQKIFLVKKNSSERISLPYLRGFLYDVKEYQEFVEVNLVFIEKILKEFMEPIFE